MADTGDLKSPAFKSVGVRVPLGLPVMKKPKKKYRNPLAIVAKTRSSSGPMRKKKDKRKNGKNKQQEFLKENE